MARHPESYRVYDVTESYCCHFVRKGDKGDGIYTGLIDCEIYHEQSIWSKINKANTGKSFRFA